MTKKQGGAQGVPSWAGSLPLIFVIVINHSFDLGLINRRASIILVLSRHRWACRLKGENAKCRSARIVQF
jgi:hypothetical protein